MNIISTKGLTKTFDYYKKQPGVWGSVKGLFHREKLFIDAVKNINLEIKEGEFIGFIGPNGAGKTTTLKMLSGILYPSSGEVSVLGYKPYERKPAFQKQFALVMGQKNQLWWDLPARESFILNKAIYEVPDDEYEKNLDQLTTLLDIKDLLDVQVRKLSLGQRMKCELTAALLHSPKVIFLDEPTIGLDVVSQKNIRDFLLQYNQQKKATIILTSHYMEDIRRLCNRVVIINHGQLIYDGTYNNLTQKYADTKRLELTLKKNINSDELKKYGEITSHRDLIIHLSIPRKDSAAITSKILQEFPIEDLIIHEKEMEEIVSEIFHRGHTK